MDKSLAEKEKTLERMDLDNQIEEKRLSVAQKKHLEKELRDQEGSGFKKVLGLIGKLKMGPEQVQTLRSQGHDLRELSILRMKRMR